MLRTFAHLLPMREHKNSDIIDQFGRNPASAAGAWEFLTADGLLNLPAAPLPVRYKAGGNAADDVAGLGLRNATIHGVDGDFRRISEVLATNGADVSAETSQSFLRVFEIDGGDVGARLVANTGAVIVENNAGVKLIEMPAGEGRSHHCHYTIPAGMTGYLQRWFVDVPSTKNVSFRLRMAVNNSATAVPYPCVRVIEVLDNVAGPYEEVWEIPFVIPEKTDIWVESNADTNESIADSEIDIILVE